MSPDDLAYIATHAKDRFLVVDDVLLPLLDKFRARAEAIADEVEPTELRELLYFLVDTVLDRSLPAAPEPESLPLVQLSK